MVSNVTIPVAQSRRQNANNSPVILPTHGEQEMKAFAPQVGIYLILNHAPGHFGIGDKEHLIVWRARERNAAQLTHGTARSVASGDPRGRNSSICTVG